MDLISIEKWRNWLYLNLIRVISGEVLPFVYHWNLYINREKKYYFAFHKKTLYSSASDIASRIVVVVVIMNRKNNCGFLIHYIL